MPPPKLAVVLPSTVTFVSVRSPPLKIPPPGVPGPDVELPEMVESVIVTVPTLKSPPPDPLAVLLVNSIREALSVAAAPTTMPPPDRGALALVRIRPSIEEVPTLKSKIRDEALPSMVMSGLPSLSMSPSMVTSSEMVSCVPPSVIVPPGSSAGAKVMISAPALAFANPIASLRLSPKPSALSVAIFPPPKSSVVELALVSTIKVVIYCSIARARALAAFLPVIGIGFEVAGEATHGTAASVMHAGRIYTPWLR